MHPLTRLANSIHAMKVSGALVDHEAVEWDEQEGAVLRAGAFRHHQEASLPSSSILDHPSPLSPETQSPLPPMLLATNCSKVPGFSGPGPVFCNVTWSGVQFPAEDDLIAM